MERLLSLDPNYEKFEPHHCLTLSPTQYFELYSHREWLFETFLAVATQRNSEMTSYLSNGYDVMNCFAKFEKFLPHGITIKLCLSEVKCQS